ncbi:class I SAM-dependent methyltransferase [Plantactinospora sp. WMMB334]|uniref:class I SAM-dependent methyltransferase n=1 Tax=Plantactinospora sp. WMMB334 TaxID=3404119 RepID=UPI003B94C4F9
MNARFWEETYRARDQIFSGNPNSVLVAEVSGLPPGRALDVGCGEGADARWLARRGWQVTALDISQTALDRAAAAGADVAGSVTWSCVDLTATRPPAGVFDLVSIHYFPLPRQPDHVALRGLLAALAPGGTLLFATHDLADLLTRPGFDPDDYYQPHDIARLLDDRWAVELEETRARTGPTPAGTHHTHDAVLRARRLRNP